MHQQFHVRINRLTKWLFLTLCLLIITNVLISLPYLHRVAEIRGVARIFSLDGERNLPTAYNVFLLLTDAVLLFVIAARAAGSGLLRSLGWLVLSAGFVFMAMDEAWTIHEDLIGPLRQRLGGTHLGLLYFSWIIPGLAVAFLAGVAYLRFLWTLPKAIRVGFIVSGIVYLSGALGMEALDGNYLEGHGNDFTYKLLTMLEEGLEMSGLILFCKYLLDYLRLHCTAIEFQFVARAAAHQRKPLTRQVRIPGLRSRGPEPVPVLHSGPKTSLEQPAVLNGAPRRDEETDHGSLRLPRLG